MVRLVRAGRTPEDLGREFEPSAQAFEFKSEFKTAFRATPARYGTFRDRRRINDLPESLNVPKPATLLTRWGSAVRVC